MSPAAYCALVALAVALLSQHGCAITCCTGATADCATTCDGAWCIKVGAENAGVEVYTRSCAPAALGNSSSAKPAMECIEKEAAGGKGVTCNCETDKCNGAAQAGLRFGAGTLLAAGAAAPMLAKLLAPAH